MYFDIPLLNRNRWELNPLILGQEYCAPGHSFGPSVRNYYLIHYVQSGKGTLRNETGVYPVKADELFVILPGQITTYTADLETPWRYIWVGFDGKRATALGEMGRFVFPYLHDTFYHMLEAKDLTDTREEFVAGQLSILFALLTAGKDEKPGYVRQVMDYIRANYMKPIQIEEIAQMVGLNRRYLSRIFKEEAGISMQEFLIQTRLSHASEYLEQGESVASAAALSGYADAFHFSRMFKSHFGIAPQRYQKRNGKAERPSDGSAE